MCRIVEEAYAETGIPIPPMARSTVRVYRRERGRLRLVAVIRETTSE
jgi:hypothetical protein